MRNIFQELNNCGSDIEPFANPSEVKKGQMLAAQFEGDYHRAKIINSNISPETGSESYQCHFVDFGFDKEVPFEKLRRFRGVSVQYATIPPRVFECRLAEVQPSSLSSERSIWTKKAKEYFEELVNGVEVLAEVNAEIYSSFYSLLTHISICRFIRCRCPIKWLM